MPSSASVRRTAAGAEDGMRIMGGLVGHDTWYFRILSSLGVAIGAALLYVAIFRVAKTTSIANDYDPFWPANGFVVGAWLQLTALQNLLFLPLTLAASILLGMENQTLLISGLFSVVNAVECLCVYWLIKGFAPKFADLATQRSSVVIVLSSIIGTTIGGSLGAAVTCWKIRGGFSGYGFELFKWFISDCLGHLTIIPFMLSLRLCRSTWDFMRKHPYKGWIGLGCLVGILAIEMSVGLVPREGNFLSSAGTIPFINHMLSFFLVLLCGSLIGTAGFTSATLLLCTSGVFALVFLSRQTTAGTILLLFRLQIFVVISTISSMTLMVIEKGRLEALAESIEANNQKVAFIAFLCHELRNPLHAILNVTSFLKESPNLSRDQHQLAEAISIASTYMSQIINDVLDTSKLESGNIRLSLSPVDVASVFLRICRQAQEDLRSRDVAFCMNIGSMPDGSRTFLADEMRVKQLLSNLLANAIKVTPVGGKIDCHMWCEQADIGDGSHRAWEVADGEEVRQRWSTSRTRGFSPRPCNLYINVSDSGAEIPPDVAGIIFKPFWMNSLQAAQDYSGTGLGLAICKHLVDLMHGSIEIHRRRDGEAGSTFLVKIPIAMVGETDETEVFVREASSTVSTVVQIEQVETAIVRTVIENASNASSTPPAMTALSSDPTEVSIELSEIVPATTSITSSRTSPPIPTPKIPGLLDLDHKTPWLTVMANREPKLPSPPIESISHHLPSITSEKCDSADGPKHYASNPTPPRTLLRQSQSPPASTSDDRAILVVDDSSINRKILERLLRRSGVKRRIEECTNGLEAVEKLSAKPEGYTGIFMDIQMPVMDGSEATRRIREMGIKIMPIIAVTASFVDEETLKKEFGFTALAPKPFLKADAEKILLDHQFV
ncbi:hypothetical protein HDU67_008770 [Dinochytrium kinnereticum]|nr:hypothetical protein HDU67_008770 [Dinochytrium kinnereticum]